MSLGHIPGAAARADAGERVPVPAARDSDEPLTTAPRASKSTVSGIRASGEAGFPTASLPVLWQDHPVPDGVYGGNGMFFAAGKSHFQKHTFAGFPPGRFRFRANPQRLSRGGGDTSPPACMSIGLLWTCVEVGPHGGWPLFAPSSPAPAVRAWPSPPGPFPFITPRAPAAPPDPSGA